MLDQYNREINYLRISITDKCNLRCIYCMPEQGIALKSHSEILRYEEIEEIVKEAVKIGIKKIRLTGGEPLIKKNIEVLIKKISSIQGIEHIGLTTNGILLTEKVKKLKEAGLKSINISMDTLDPEKYKYITRGGDLQKVLQGIEAALRTGGFKLKINMVILKDTQDPEIKAMQQFCNLKGIKLQCINHFSLKKPKEEDYKFERPPKCETCNRIRLLSDGKLKFCLHSDEEYQIDFKNIAESLINCIQSKPQNGNCCNNRNMNQIGG